ncbi:MAG: hypothetical protein KM312_09595 [Hydrogenibacillus schlegelii]|uniref:PTS EIIA type-4 domain-containing protein n=1 Tax=Hydrogenibacillus schlegelii TaxID=1484 RepID=A0A947GHH8_HYDSH|nr:hypothetical protein [Hydrogenibacillus schlegelii]
MQTAAGNVALVIVSHSRALAEGVRELAARMGGPGVAIYVAAGTPDGGLGTDTEEVRQTLLQALEAREAAVLLFDLGSAYLSSTAALELLDEPFRERVVIADAPLVCGWCGCGGGLRISGRRKPVKKLKRTEQLVRGDRFLFR